MAAEGITALSKVSTPPAHHPESLLRSAGIVGITTAFSRILGFARDWLIAVSYGTSLTAQAFVVAFRVPNLLRDLVGEGAANAAFVPLFSGTRTARGREEWLRLAQALWVRLLLGAVGISAAGVAAAPWLVRWVAPGFASDPALLQLTTELTRILFPFIGLVGLAAFFMGLLNSVHHFALPSLGPALLNLCMIAGLLLWRPEAKGLAWGIIVGGLLQLLIQIPALRREGFGLRLRWTQHPGVREAGQLMIPRAVGSGVHQISVLVDTVFASFGQLVGQGGVAALYFAHRFLHLPLALFGISMAQAALPTLSVQAVQGDPQAARRTLSLALRASLAIALPSSVGLILLAHPIIRTLLQHGQFSADSTRLTVAALQWYAVGICSLCAAKVLANALYAFQDTWTPVRSAAVALVMNALLNLILIRPMGLAGLALATSLSSSWNAFHLYRAVRRRVGPMASEWTGSLLRLAAASAGMGLLVQGMAAAGSGLAWLAATVLAGLASFFGLAILLRVEEIQKLRAWLFRRS